MTKIFEKSELNGGDEDHVEMDSVVEDVQSALENKDDETSSLNMSFTQVST